MSNYLFYPHIIEQNINKLNQAFLNLNLDFSHYYSVKTNPARCVLDQIAKTQSSFEIVSKREWQLVKRYHKKKIILNGPNKTLSLVENILSQSEKLILNIDNDTDIEILKKIDKKNRKNLFLGIRIFYAKNSLNWTRFGYNINSSRTLTLINKLNKLYHLDGFHFHSSYLAVDPNRYKNIFNAITKVITENNLTLEFLDIGGGYVESFDERFQKNMYEIVPGMIHRYFSKLQIFSEFGRNIVSNAFDLKSKISSLKKVGNQKYVINLDLNIYHFMCFFDHRYEIICQQAKTQKEKTQFTLDIYGNSCMQIDALASNFCTNIKPSPGDVFFIKNIGAYSISMASNFICNKPKIRMINYEINPKNN